MEKQSSNESGTLGRDGVKGNEWTMAISKKQVNEHFKLNWEKLREQNSVREGKCEGREC